MTDSMLQYVIHSWFFLPNCQTQQNGFVCLELLPFVFTVYYGFVHHQYNDVHSYNKFCKKRKNQIKEESEYLFKSSHFCLGVGALEKKDLAMLMANFSQIRVRICNMQLPFVICIWKKRKKEMVASLIFFSKLNFFVIRHLMKEWCNKLSDLWSYYFFFQKFFWRFHFRPN